VDGARVVVCDGCGRRVEAGAAEVPCASCGSRLCLPEGAHEAACPHCRAAVRRT
jgi:DNA-directed RNA polymerase subunit RPC12/RpoP